MKMRPFELALVIIFIVLLVVALVMLANYSPKPKDSETAVQIQAPITIWGTLSKDSINTILGEAAQNDKSFGKITYKYFSEKEFNWRLVNALADGVGPDLVLISHEELASLRGRIAPISYEFYPLPDLRNNYIAGAEIFALSDGLYGFPLAVDPLMLYWNRDILATEGYLEPPKTWETLINSMFPTLIDRGFDRSINQSVVSMGEYGNVRNGFGILSMLLIQGGTVGVTENKGAYSVDLQSAIGGGTDPLRAAADFYTRFSRPSNSLYSWNRALPEDRIQFAAEKLVFYFGFASEAREIERLNPNLNFGISEVPQGASASLRRTYGKFYTLAVMKNSKSPGDSQKVLYTLGSDFYSKRIAETNNLVPAFRSSAAAGSNDIYGREAYLSAPISYGWLNPDKDSVDVIFSTMTSDINENRRDLTGASGDAANRISLEF